MVVAEKPVEIRALRESDLVAIGVIESASYEYPWSAGIFFDCLSVGYYCRVLDLQGQPAAYAVLSIGASEAHILNLTVSPEYRRQGLGRCLLLDLLAHARTRSLHRIYLEVRHSNDAARVLYKAEGFELIGLRRQYYRSRHGREDALVFALSLDESASSASGTDPRARLV
ncbi:MAG: ribosomal protein S18-alanine N-acetyltransferase [Gammaproteobacteria bacterium]|nr:ribosomal protein S18-alanine N-acetyltransferase [Gammaproteobacteria bacterium]